jgi:hypothetical protein
VDGSIDARLAHALVNKARVINAALDGTRPDAPRTAADIDLSFPDETPERTKRVQALTEAQVDAIHDALRYLAGVCDGARKLDNCGFNKMDARIGRELARLPGLSQRQAQLGRRMALKYHRQLGENLIARIKAAEGDEAVGSDAEAPGTAGLRPTRPAPSLPAPNIA